MILQAFPLLVVAGVLVRKFGWDEERPTQEVAVLKRPPTSSNFHGCRR